MINHEDLIRLNDSNFSIISHYASDWLLYKPLASGPGELEHEVEAT